MTLDSSEPPLSELAEMEGGTTEVNPDGEQAL
jgi:hypothetical protein